MCAFSDDEKERRLLRLRPATLVRYQVVSEIRAKLGEGKTLAEAVVEVVAAPPRIALDGAAVEVTRRSAYRWYAAFRKRGIEGLERAPAPKGPRSRVLSVVLRDFLRAEKAADRYASVPELIRRARERGLVAAEERVDRTTVYRAVVRMGLPLRRVPGKREADQRRFAYPHRMMMVLADGKHFRAGARRTRRVVVFFLDDATRYGLAAVVGTAESATLFLRGVHRVIERFGYADSYFLDGGPGFIAGDTSRVFILLETGLIHGTAGYPEGHGKIERFHQTADGQVLRGLPGAADVDDDLGAIELRLEHYLAHRYNQTPHEALGGKTPQARWDEDTRALRFPRDENDLRRRFVLSEARRVSNDNVVSVDGTDYEVPRGHGGTLMPVYRRVLCGELFVSHDQKLVTLHPVDLHRNAYDRRARPAAPAPTDDEGAPTTAAALAFARDLGPIVGADGGFSGPTREGRDDPFEGDPHDD